jgi:glycosyltransferase involved in cell wall biosynthesis
MHILVIGHVLHKTLGDQVYAYGPYVREMNRWFQYADQVTIISPLDSNLLPDPIDLPYVHRNLKIEVVPEINLLSIGSTLKTFFKLPGMLIKIARSMDSVDHIHLRCPGNMGLLGALVQIGFPRKIKTAKYAGNWDRSSAKPFTYRLQQRIISSPKWSKNMTVLAYGEWPGESENVRPFFTASYSEREKEALLSRNIDKNQVINLVFVGGLVSGKNPLLAAQVAFKLIQNKRNVQLEFYGEGAERSAISTFIKNNDLEQKVFLRGNVPAETVKRKLQRAHFLIFLSQSEGWPKVVAEAMFWGCLPVTTRVSCVPQMLGEGSRGNLVSLHIDEVVRSIESDLDEPNAYFKKTQAAAEWSRQFTLEKFEREISQLLSQR